MANKIVKTDGDVSMAEVTQTDGQTVLNRAYSVTSKSDPTARQSFGDMGSADTYFEKLQLQRLNPK
jgi:hypothetical protein